MTTMDKRITRLMVRYLPGDLVRAVETIVYGTGEEVPEGTVGRIQQHNVHECAPLVIVQWHGLPDIAHPVSAESLERILD